MKNMSNSNHTTKICNGHIDAKGTYYVVSWTSLIIFKVSVFVFLTWSFSVSGFLLDLWSLWFSLLSLSETRAEDAHQLLEFSEDEEALIARMFRLVGNRYSFIIYLLTLRVFNIRTTYYESQIRRVTLKKEPYKILGSQTLISNFWGVVLLRICTYYNIVREPKILYGPSFKK